MTAEEQAAVEWLEGLTFIEHVRRFKPPLVGGGVGHLFSFKEDHEVTLKGNCYRCKGAERHGTLVVIE